LGGSSFPMSSFGWSQSLGDHTTLTLPTCLKEPTLPRFRPPLAEPPTPPPLLRGRHFFLSPFLFRQENHNENPPLRFPRCFGGFFWSGWTLATSHPIVCPPLFSQLRLARNPVYPPPLPFWAGPLVAHGYGRNSLSVAAEKMLSYLPFTRTPPFFSSLDRRSFLNLLGPALPRLDRDRSTIELKCARPLRAVFFPPPASPFSFVISLY